MVKTTKHHFEALDGLRGVAAIAVVIFHFMEVVVSDYRKNIIGHGFLAVDFFFCLSGFVIAYAYDEKINRVSLAEFFKWRLIRLHPMVIMGTILGVLGIFIDPFCGAGTYSVGRFALIFLSSLLIIPFPVMPDRAFNLFGLNAPAWSLFWEYVANIAYALVLHRLKRWMLLCLLILASIALLCVAAHAGNVEGGWAGENFWQGGVRMAYSFTGGVLIFRYRLIIKSKLNFLIMAMLLSFAFLMPYVKWDWLAEALIVMLYFPFIVMLGAGVQVVQHMQKVCSFLGNLSYPLYMSHYWFVWIFAHWLSTTKPDNTTITLVVVGGVLFLIAFSYGVMIFYDIPFRKYLARKRITV